MLQATVKDSPIKIREKTRIEQSIREYMFKKSEKTSGGEYEHTRKFFSDIVQLCHNNTVKFILPFTVKKSIKIPDFKDSNALFCVHLSYSVLSRQL